MSGAKAMPVNIVARTRRFVVLSQADLGRPALVAKIFRFLHPQNTSRTFAIPPHTRGVSCRHIRRGGMRWTRQRFARDEVAGQVERFVSDRRACGREMLQRTAKSCGPDAPTLASSLRMLGRPYRAQAQR